METNDDTAGRDFATRKALLVSLVANLEPGADGRAGMGAIIRELEQMRLGLVDQIHARQTRRKLGLPDLSALDWPEEPSLCPAT